MTAWWDGPFVAFDTETTGVDTAHDRIVTASWVRINPGQRPTFFNSMIAVDVDIPTEAQAVHGISTQYAREHGERANLVLEGLAADLAIAMNRGFPVVGFNVSFDLSLLENELARNNIPTLHERLGGRVRPVVDSFVIDKHTDPYRKGSRKLGAVCAHHAVLHGGEHDAAADALAAARLAVAIVRGNVETAGMGLAELHDAQVGWRREQCESLAAYFAKQGKPADVDPCWPVCRGHAESAVA